MSVHQVGFNFSLYKMHGEYNIKHSNNVVMKIMFQAIATERYF